VRDLDRLLDAAAGAKLYVIVQPGPYIEAGADAAGLPDWLLARNGRAGSIASRYAHESREWLRDVNGIIARHQLTAGTGTVVVYDAGGDAATGSRRAFERAVRRDGVTVPFASRTYARAYEDVNWGWTGDPVRAYVPNDAAGGGAVASAGADAGPTLGIWRTHGDDAEARPVFEDQAWPPLGSAVPLDTDEGARGRPRVHASGKPQFLGVDDYGFHHGAVWYRGHFTAGGGERAFAFGGMSGRGGACAAWLDGAYLGSATAARDGTIAAVFQISPGSLRRGSRAVVSVLFENMGHNEPLDRDLGRAEPRGMLRAALVGSATAIDWHVLGNGEYNTDPVRGPLATGGLAGEIAGWQDPSFVDSAWPTTTLPARAPRPGVTWYRTRVTSLRPLGAARTFALRIDDARPTHYRALLYVNGWLIGHYVSGAGAQRVFPIPRGLLHGGGDETLAIAAWSLDAQSGLGRVGLATVDAFAPAHTTLAAIPEVRSNDGVARLRLDVAAGPGGAPRFWYRGERVAPTVRVRPGDTLEIALHNALPATGYAANAVNLHFHGLEVSPAQPGDDVLMTLAKPGRTLHYVVRVPTTQQPGLYWYHSHSHGETYWQITSGLSGALIVDGLERRDGDLATMRERTLIVRDVQDAPDIMAIPWYARRMTLARAPGAAAATTFAAHIDPDDNTASSDPCLPEVGLHITVNGGTAPAIPIANGARQLFRVVNAAAGRVLDLTIDNEDIGIVALDGYALNAYPGSPAIAWVRHVVVPPAGRAEFVATGQAGPTTLRSRCYDSGAAGDRDPEAVLATLQSVDEAPAAASTEPADLAAPPAGAIADTSGPVVAHRTIRLSEDAKGFYVNGRAFSMNEPPTVVARSGTLEEWTILNETDEIHAFHLHQVHFVVESVDGVSVSPRAWRDTVLVPVRHGPARPGSVKVLVDFRNPIVRGTFVFHCHMLDHEDGGMMAKIRVI
jgi:FtsP/CotA-like multicopper oxidase with cupredoxin domain